MAEAKAQLASAQARLAETELQLARTSLYAPFTGRVTLRQIDQGEFVTAGTQLGEVYATNVKTPGIPVILSANVAGVYSEWQGRIVRTDSRFDSQTRVLYAYAEVRDPFGAGASNGVPLAPGLFVTAAIDGQKLDNVIVIPRTALRGEDKVYLAKDDTLSIKTVTVMSSNRDEAILVGGIEIGDAVITEKIIKWWASNPVAANLLMLICFIGGIVSYAQIERELEPYVEFPGAWTFVSWPGASPQDVEEQIIVRMEEALSEVQGVNRMWAFAGEGGGSVTVVGKNGVDEAVLMADVKRQIDSINTFPPAAEEPQINVFRNRDEIIRLAVSGDDSVSYLGCVMKKSLSKSQKKLCEHLD